MRRQRDFHFERGGERIVFARFMIVLVCRKVMRFSQSMQMELEIREMSYQKIRMMISFLIDQWVIY
jgi:hypothetical protein